MIPSFITLCTILPLWGAPPPVAHFQQGSISAAAVELRGQAALYEARKALYELKIRIAEDLAFDALLEAEGRKQKVPPTELLQHEIALRAQEPTHAEIQTALEELRGKGTLPQDPTQAQQSLLAWLKGKDRSRAIHSYRAEILKKAGFHMALPPPRLDVPIRADNPSEGLPSAAITLIVFSDFQCTHCRTLNDRIQALGARYPGQLRIVHKQLPLDIHPQARRAAEVYLHGGGSPELRDRLFAAEGHPERAQLPVQATPQRPAAEVERTIDLDREEAAALGIQGAPALTLNGRLVLGAPPLEVLVRMVEEEFAWAKVGMPLPAPAAALPTAAPQSSRLSGVAVGTPRWGTPPGD